MARKPRSEAGRPGGLRVSRRTEGGAGQHGILINKVVEKNGRPVLLRKIYSQLAEFVSSKQIHPTISCGSQTLEQTYDAPEAVLARAAVGADSTRLSHLERNS